MQTPSCIGATQTFSRPGPLYPEFQYGGWFAEYDALATGSGMVDFRDSTQIELTGGDAPAFLNRLGTNAVAEIAPGEGCETFVTDVKGRVLAHLLVFRRQHSLLLRTTGGQSQTIVDHLDRYLIRDRVEVHDRTGQYSELLLAGPRSEAVLAQLTEASPPTAHLGHREMELAGLAVWVGRFDLGEVVGIMISSPAETSAALWRALEQAGVRRCGQTAWDAIRIEAGWPCYGQDISEENLPQEVGRNRQAISFTKGCYLGQEVVARIESRGHVNRQLVGLRWQTSAVPPPGTELTIGGANRGSLADQPYPVAGRVTSAAFSPRLRAGIALGYVRRDWAVPGTILGSPFGSAEVTELPMKK
jgi:hypothetical protein